MVQAYIRRRPPEVKDKRSWWYPAWTGTPVEHRFPIYVSVVLLDKAYGGAEEGGWYYDTSEPIETVRADTEERVQEAVREFQTDEDYDNEGRPPITSVTSKGVYEIHVTDSPPIKWPMYRPRYG